MEIYANEHSTAHSVERMSDISAFEYATVRVPYETLNRQFRVAQKTLEREVSHTEATLKDLDRVRFIDAIH